MKYLLRILGAICAGAWGCIGANGRDEILPDKSHSHSDEWGEEEWDDFRRAYPYL